MSYLEIYNENIRDLLNTGSGHLELRDDSKGKNIQVAGLSEVTTKSTEEVPLFLFFSDQCDHIWKNFSISGHFESLWRNFRG